MRIDQKRGDGTSDRDDRMTNQTLKTRPILNLMTNKNENENKLDSWNHEL